MAPSLVKTLKGLRGRPPVLLLVVALSVGLVAACRHVLFPPTVTVGVLFSLTQPQRLGVSEVDMLTAAQAYVDWHNGQALRPSLRLLAAGYDDDVEEKARKLRDEGAQVLLGASLSSFAAKAAVVAEKLALPLVSPSAQADFLTGKDDYFFRLRGTVRRSASALAGLLRHLEPRRVLAFSTAENVAYGRALIDGVREMSSMAIEEIVVGEDLAFVPPPGIAPDLILVVLPPSLSFWIFQQIRALWPEATLVLSAWTLSADLRDLEGLEGFSFYFAENFDLWSREEDPFMDYCHREYANLPPFSFYNVAAALTFLVDVFAEDPSASGERLRDLMARPRRIGRPLEEIAIDRWGDAVHPVRLFFRDAKGTREVVLP